MSHGAATICTQDHTEDGDTMTDDSLHVLAPMAGVPCPACGGEPGYVCVSFHDDHGKVGFRGGETCSCCWLQVLVVADDTIEVENLGDDLLDGAEARRRRRRWIGALVTHAIARAAAGLPPVVVRAPRTVREELDRVVWLERATWGVDIATSRVGERRDLQVDGVVLASWLPTVGTWTQRRTVP